MDWNKANTILITAFIILNIFLFTAFYKGAFYDEYDVSADEEFTEDIKNILKEKNIAVNCQLPEETYMLDNIHKRRVPRPFPGAGGGTCQGCNPVWQ